MAQRESIEEATKRIGCEIIAAIQARRPADFSQRTMRDPLVQWAARGPEFLGQVFRFIDVYPVLRDDAELMEYLAAYLPDPAMFLPLGLPLSAEAVRTLIAQLQRRFIAGETIDEAFQRCRTLRETGRDITLDVLGEAVLSVKEEEAYAAAYAELIRRASDAVKDWPAVPSSPPEVNISLKLSSLYCRLDPIDPARALKHAGGRLREIFRLAREHHATINVDMEQRQLKDLTLDIFKQVLMEPEFRDWPGASITIQTYLLSHRQDMEDMADWARRRGTPVGVRLVKGAYWDHEVHYARYRNWPEPVYLGKELTDEAFEASTIHLLGNHEWLRPAIAGHNIRSIAFAMASAGVLNLPPDAVEYQTLYGLGEEAAQALVDRKLRMRVYAPYGRLRPGMAYLVRRLLEATARSAFLRQMWREPLPDAELLQTPGPGEAHAHNIPQAFCNEPPSDFAQASARKKMTDAVENVRTALNREVLPVISGETVAAAEFLEWRNPGETTQIVARVGMASVRDAGRAVRAAMKAFPEWSRTPVRQRVKILRDTARLLRAQRFELAALEMFETAKGWREADGDIAEAIDYCEFYSDEILRLHEARERPVSGERNLYFYAPRGVVAAITPWNFPLAILTGVVAAALAAGNTVVMKPAEQSSLTASELARILAVAGLPSGVLQFLPGRGEAVGRALARHKDVSVIAFTGSMEVGAEINRAASVLRKGQQQIKRVIAEMGGKNAIIIDRDADLDQAVPGVLQSAFGYQGQKCSACSRAIVLPELYDEFIKRLAEAARSLPVGPAWDPGAAIGPVISEEAQRRVLEYAEAARKPARVVFEGEPNALSGAWYVPPMILADVDPHSRIAREEIFGPVLSVIRAKNLNEAFAIANDVVYGLTAGLYSRHPEHIARARTALQAGNIYVNRPITGALADKQPFGGIKLSGVGSKTGGPDYLLQFLQPVSFTEYTVRRGFAPMENFTSTTETQRAERGFAAIADFGLRNAD